MCGSENVSKNGTSKAGKQQYICNNKQCSKSSFILDYTYNVCKPEIKNKIIPMQWHKRYIKNIKNKYYNCNELYKKKEKISNM